MAISGKIDNCTRIELGPHSGGVFGAQITALPGVSPGDFGYFFCVYRNEQLLFGQAPNNNLENNPYPITNNGQIQSQGWPLNLAASTYTIGLATDNGQNHDCGCEKTTYKYNYKSYCCALTFYNEQSGQPPKIVNTTISATSLMSDTIYYSYNSPDGNNPEKDGHHVFLFESNVPLFNDDSAVVANKAVNNSNNEGQGFFQYTFRNSTQYCLAYATGTRLKDICAYSSFKVQ